MATITLRSTKGSPLTNNEVDANFTNLNNDKLESSTYTASDVLTKIKTVDGASSGLDADLLDGLQSATANTVSTIVARDSSGNFSAGTITADLVGDVTGNADTATSATSASSAATLTTARTIGGVSFNGSANINLPGVNTAGNQNTSGNAATATAWATARTLSLTGNVTGTATGIDGSGNISLSTTVASVPSSAIPNATSTAVGGVKMRVDGSTIYITNDGTNA